MSLRAPEFVRPEPASREIAKHLLNYLLSGDFEPGAQLPSERQMSEQLGIGRSAVREAVKALTFLGIVESRPGSGTYLAHGASDILPRVIDWGLLMGDHTLDDLIEARSMLEIHLATQAAARRSADDITRLTRAYEAMAAAEDDVERYVIADVEFHLLIGEISGNAVIAGMLRSVASLLHVWSKRVITRDQHTARSLSVHAHIFEAIVAGESDAARRAMEEHMSNAVRNLRSAIAEESFERALDQSGRLAEQ